jgi:fumarylacetoacetate (FAA) hydrolase family protein
MHSTYAFEDLHVTITHAAIGQLSLQGTGIGTITFTMTNDVSAHDLAADGSVMTSKMKAANGTIAIAVQQTSDAHAWFTRLYNHLMPAYSSEFAQISLMATAPNMQVTHTAENMAIQKRPDKPYQQQGQQVTWTFLAADLDERNA